MSTRILAGVFALLIGCSGNVPPGGTDGGGQTDGGTDDTGVAMDSGTKCNASNCAGCCMNDACQPGNTIVACGKGGGVCAACSMLRICSQTTQSCEFDPNAMWKVQPTSALISTTNQGSDWDVGAGAPDPFVQLWCPATSSVPVQTATAADTFMPTWSTGGCLMKEKDLISTGFGVQVWDEDISSNDAISGKGTIVATDMNLTDGYVTVTAMPTLITMKVALLKQ